MKTRLRYLSLISTAFALILSISCDDDNPLEADPLSGSIAGEAWNYKYAKANYNEVDNVYDASLFGTQQTESDPCGIFISGESHISMQLPNEVGNYQIPSDVGVLFELPGSGNDFFRATSGFIEVTSAAGGQIVGFVQVNYDDDNSVEGSFSFARCN